MEADTVIGFFYTVSEFPGETFPGFAVSVSVAPPLFQQGTAAEVTGYITMGMTADTVSNNSKDIGGIFFGTKAKTVLVFTPDKSGYAFSGNRNRRYRVSIQKKASAYI
jgi:hypothetical protein